MKKISFTLIFFALIINLYSCKNGSDDPKSSKSGSIYGIVTDFATGEAVAHANVQLRPTGETTLTGYDGLYEFSDIQDGNYSITVSKAEYTDLIDKYVIEVKNGRRMRRDVQIEKIPTYIRFTDMMGNDIKELDFGSNASLNMQSFNVYNNGTVENITCQLAYSCDWIESVSPKSFTIKRGDNVMVSIQINRAKLANGENQTKLYISSNNGSNVILVKATSSSGNPPRVRINSVDNITTTSALCTGIIQSDNGGSILDCGFCYGKKKDPSLTDNVIKLGAYSGLFSHSLLNLESGETYHIRAFATSNLGTGYSQDFSFTTLSGIPICGETTISQLDPTVVRAQSTASCGNGSAITEKGFCWGTTSSPTINNQKVICGLGNGDFQGYLSSLQPSTTYWVRSYAINEFGTGYGPSLSFVSHSGLALVTTKNAYLSGDEIITGGDVADNAGTVVIDRGVCYGFSHNPNLSWSYEHTNDGDGDGSFTSRFQKPNGSGYLYIRAYATTKYGTSYGDEVFVYI